MKAENDKNVKNVLDKALQGAFVRKNLEVPTRINPPYTEMRTDEIKIKLVEAKIVLKKLKGSTPGPGGGINKKKF